MSQTIQCPHCGQTYALTDEQVPQYSGQTISCTRCQKPFTVPSLPLTSSPPPLHATPQYAGAPMGQQQIQYGGYAQKQTSGLAIAALACGIAALVIPILPAILAVIFGVMALGRTRDPRVGGKGLAIAGICLGGVFLALNICAFAVIVPSLGRARQTAQRVHCASNMRQIGQAILLYANQNRGAYPEELEILMPTQGLTADVFCCPSSSDTAAPTPTQLTAGGHLSYVYVGKGLNNQAGGDVVVMWEKPANHGNDGCNFLYADGHVAWESQQTAQKIIANVQAGKNPPP